jgi:uncharacterized protein YbcC (UPF0753/DUF2309 family)
MTTSPATDLDPDAVTDVATQQAAVRAEIADAAAFLAPTWPLADFIAVNPLSGLLDRPFSRRGHSPPRDLLGARATPDETWLRAAWQRGRITDDDLRAALTRRHPAVLRRSPLALGDRVHDPVDLLLADLQRGIACPPPHRRARTAAEALAPDLAGLLDTHTIQWCSAFLDEGQATWRMPGRDRGFYPAWRALAAHDTTLPRPVRARLRHLPERAEDAVLEALAALGVPDDRRTHYLQAHLTRLPGFAAHVRWRGEQADEGIDLVDYLALRLGAEAAVLAGTHSHGTAWALARTDLSEVGQATVDPLGRAQHLLSALEITGTHAAQRTALAELLDELPVHQRALVWLDAYEEHYRSRLLRLLDRPLPEQPDARPQAQVVCCIDPRSEGLRRHLETLGNYRTLGFAGFFAVAMRYRDLAGGTARTQCPGPITPRHTVTEHPSPWSAAGGRAVTGRAAGCSPRPSTPCTPPRTTWWRRSCSPKPPAGWPGRLPRPRPSPPAPPVPLARGGPAASRPSRRPRSRSPRTSPSPKRAATAETMLTLMGLTGGFARLVVLCGHGAHTDNNPYQAALDCGACGGHPGGPNARTAAALLNDPQVRRAPGRPRHLRSR